MKYTIIISIVICIFSSSMVSQANYRVQELLHERVENYAEKIEMSTSEKQKLKTILLDYDLALGKTAQLTKKAYEEAWIKINDQRNSSIATLLGSQRYKLFKILNEIEIDGLLESNHEIVSSISDNIELNRELLKYRVENILPVLSKVHRAWSGQMSVNQYYEYRRLRERYYEYGEWIVNHPEAQVQLFVDFITAEENSSLSKLCTRESEALDQIIANLNPLRQKWEADQKVIMSQHLNDNALKLLDKESQLLSIYQIKKREYLLHFIMLVPDDPGRYLDNLNLILNEQVYFEKLLSLLK